MTKSGVITMSRSNIRDWRIRQIIYFQPKNPSNRVAKMAKRSSVSAKNASTAPSADQQLIAKLLAKPWYAHETWADFMRWTAKLPTAEAVASYPMPEKIKKMRLAPGMLIRVLKGDPMPAAEEEDLEPDTKPDRVRLEGIQGYPHKESAHHRPYNPPRKRYSPPPIVISLAISNFFLD